MSMGGRLRIAIVGMGGALALGLLPLGTGAAAGSSATVCSGSLAPGTYHSLVVPAGDTCDLGNGPVTVVGGTTVEPGATLMLGQEDPGGPLIGTFRGGLVADHAAQVQIHNAVITGGVNVQGGSGPFGCTVPFGPTCFTDFEDDVINGGATINGYDGFWLGFIRNQVNGTTAITNNNQSDDEIDVGSNSINGNLICSGNTPTENTGDSPSGPDGVTGHDTCNESSG